MVNSFCEDSEFSKLIIKTQNNAINNAFIPKWSWDYQCPFCSSQMTPECVRKIGVCFNPRNFGDIFVEMFCVKCSKMETLYFRHECKNINDFIMVLKKEDIDTKWLTETEMYRSGYNNIVDMLAMDEGNKQNAK